MERPMGDSTQPLPNYLFGKKYSESTAMLLDLGIWFFISCSNQETTTIDE